MALDKSNENYYYNLGRVIALVEIINDLPHRIVSKMFDNPFQILPYWLKKSLFNEKHNLHKELLDPADVVLMKGEIPHGMVSSYDKTGSCPIGYYHEKSYLDKTYHGIYGKVETEVSEHVPQVVNAETVDNNIEELRK